MLKLLLGGNELYDSSKNLFIEVKPQFVTLEHSLVSLSKWESNWEKPFLNSEEKTYEETIDYIKCMTITQNVDPNVYLSVSKDNIQKVNDYINKKMTATWFSNKKNQANKSIITSEIIYYWMIALNIPFECQKWHLNRLLTLVQVCEEKNKPQKKMSTKEIAEQHRSLNEARRKVTQTRG